uniref:Metallophos domain-containing protein n=1 Tax=Panagrellus redivivus TaxID=6233 RepID=A0A7E4W0C9_PANRE
MSRFAIILFVFVEIVLLVTRFLLLKMGYTKFAQIVTLLFAQFIAFACSVVLFRRVTSIPPRGKPSTQYQRYARRILGGFVILWVGLAHLSFFFFNVPLAGDFFLPPLCFFALGSFLHSMIFLLLFFIVEKVSSCIPGLETPILKSRRLHAGVAVSLALILSLHGLSVTQSRPTLKTVNISIPGLPVEFDGFSIALVTDIHIGPTVGEARVRDIVQIVNQLQSDVVAISGDLVDGYVDYLRPRALPIAELRSRYGSYLALGNHEFVHDNVDKWIKFFKDELNVTTLGNTAVVLEKDGRNLCLAGVDDLFSNSLNLNNHKMNATAALSYCPSNTTTVMLVHQPNGADQILNSLPSIPGNKQIDLILSGHTHGGQMFVVYPFTYLINKFLHGHYTHAGSGAQIYVSSGVNYWGPPIKMPNLCEIVNVRLHAT